MLEEKKGRKSTRRSIKRHRTKEKEETFLEDMIIGEEETHIEICSLNCINMVKGVMVTTKNDLMIIILIDA